MLRSPPMGSSRAAGSVLARSAHHSGTQLGLLQGHSNMDEEAMSAWEGPRGPKRGKRTGTPSGTPAPPPEGEHVYYGYSAGYDQVRLDSLTTQVEYLFNEVQGLTAEITTLRDGLQGVRSDLSWWTSTLEWIWSTFHHSIRSWSRRRVRTEDARPASIAEHATPAPASAPSGPAPAPWAYDPWEIPVP